MAENPFVQAWPARSDGSYPAPHALQRPLNRPAAALSAGLPKASATHITPSVQIDPGCTPPQVASNDTLSQQCSDTKVGEPSPPIGGAYQSKEPENTDPFSQKSPIQERAPVSATDLEDGAWMKCMEKFNGFNKASVIAQMVGGVYTHLYTDYYVVHSQSENCRMVDMLFFNCSCPKVTFPCSHIMAAALAFNNRRYVGKVVLMKNIEQHVIKVLHKSKSKHATESVVSAIAAKVKTLCNNAQEEGMLLELLLGVVVRLFQVAYGLVPHDADIMGRSKSRYIERMGTGCWTGDAGGSDKPSAAHTAPESSQVLANLEKSDNNATSTTNVECSCDLTPDKSVEFLSRQLLGRFGFLMEDIGPLPEPSNEQDMVQNITSMVPMFRRILEEDYGINARSKKGHKALRKTISNALENHCKDQKVSPIVDGYALGYDYIERRKPPSQLMRAEDDPKSAVKMRELYDQIIASPMMADIHRVTKWSVTHQMNHGTLKGVLENFPLDVLGDMMFITLKNDSAIKVPSPKGFASPCDILQVMISAINNNDPRSFCAHGLTLLVSVKKISLLPPMSALTNAVNSLFLSQSLNVPGALFVAECIGLMPEMLILPFCSAYFDNTDAFGNKSMRHVAIHMYNLITKGRMSDSVREKLLLIGSFFNIPASVYCEKAKGILATSGTGCEEAPKVSNEQTAKYKSLKTVNKGSCTPSPIVYSAALPRADVRDAVIPEVQQTTQVSSICAAPDYKSSETYCALDNKQGPVTVSPSVSVNVENAHHNKAENEQVSAYVLLDQVDKWPTMKFSLAQEKRYVDLIVEKAHDTDNGGIDTIPKPEKGVPTRGHNITPSTPKTGGTPGVTASDAAHLHSQLWGTTDPELATRGKMLIRDIRYQEFGLAMNPQPGDNKSSQTPDNRHIAAVLSKQRQKIARSIERLAEDLYINRTHFQLELLQNADDNDYDVESPEIAFLLDQGGIVVINNERGFSEKDVRSICDIGASSKIGSNESKTGKFGIGFKSVFLVTQSPYVFSNGYHFMFSTNPNMLYNTDYILPHWVSLGKKNNPFGYVRTMLSDPGDTVYSAFVSQFVQRHGAIPNTLMYLPFKEDVASGKHGFFSDFQQLYPLHLAFLRKLTTITLVDITQCTVTRISKKMLVRKNVRMVVNSQAQPEVSLTTASSVVLPVNMLDARFQAIMISTEVGNIFNNISTVQDTCVCMLTHNFMLGKIERLSVGLSKKSSKGCAVTVGLPLLPDVVGGKTYSVYNVLPVADYGVPFMVNADFVLSASRQNIIGGDPWNIMLTKRAGEAFALMVLIISKAFRHLPNVYRNVLYAIPGKYAGTGGFEMCCAEARQLLQHMPWVAVEGESNLTVRPSNAVIPPDNTCLMSQKDAREITRAVFDPQLLKDCCDTYYASVEFHDPYLRAAMLDVGINEMDVAFICKLMIGLRTKIDVSIPLSSQPQLAQQFFRNIGVVLCLLERMALPSDIDGIREVLLLVDSQGMLIFVDDCTVFARSGMQTEIRGVHKVVSSSLFENRWEIEGYENRVACLLERLGCIELTEKGTLSKLITTNVRKILNSRDCLSCDDILKQGRDVLHFLALNCDKLASLGPKDIEVIRSMPVVVNTGKIARLGDPLIRFCPDHISACKLMTEDNELVKHYDNIRTFAAYKDLHHMFLSDEYLEGIAKYSKPSHDGFTFKDFVDTLAHIGVFSFITYAPLHLSVDACGKYELPVFPDDIGIAVQHRITKLDSDLRQSRQFGVHRTVKDWYSPDFARVVAVVRQLHGSDPCESRGGEQTSEDKGNDVELQLRRQCAHQLSTLMYHIMIKELEIHPDYCLATLQCGDRQQPLGRSLLYYQLRHIPWLPYEECVYKSGEQLRSDGVWQVALPIALENDIGYSCTLFKRLDAQVKNELLLPKKSYDLLEILDFLCAKCGKADIESRHSTETQTDTSQWLQHWTDAPTLHRLNHSFSKEYFDSILFNEPGVLRRIIASIYNGLYRAMQEDCLFALRVRTTFHCRNLVVVFASYFKSPGSPKKPMLCTSKDPKLAIYKSIIGCEGLAVLTEDYAEFPELTGFWKALGIKQIISVEETLRILDGVTNENVCEHLETVFECIIHLYNVMDKVTFIRTIWKRECIPVTCVYADMFLCGQEGSTRSSRMDRLVAPASGIILARSWDSGSIIQKFPLDPKLGIWVASRPVVGLLYSNTSQYLKRYSTDGNLNVDDMWERVLKTLGASEFKDYCQLQCVAGSTVAQCPWPMNSYLLVALLPYVNHYLKHRMIDQYDLCCQRILYLLHRIAIVITTSEVMMVYQYRKGDVLAKSARLSGESFVHCEGIGTMKIYAVVDTMPEHFAYTADVISSAQNAAKNGKLKSLPASFFVNLAKVLLVDPAASPKDINRRFMETNEHERMLGEFMCTVYEMIRSQPKDAVDVFVKGNSNGPSGKCLCADYVAAYPRKPLGSSTTIAAGCNVTGKDTSVKKDSKADADITIKKCEAPKQLTDKVTSDPAAAKKLPLMDGYGSHLDSGDTCLKKVMDPFIYHWLYAPPVGDQFLKKAASNSGLSPAGVNARSATTAKACLPDTKNKEASKSLVPFKCDVAGSAAQTSVPVDVVNKSAQPPSAVMEVTQPVDAADDSTILLRSEVCAPHVEAADAKGDGGNVERSFTPAAKHTNVILTAANDSMHSPLHVEQNIVSVPRKDPTDHGTTVQLYHGRSTSCKEVNKHLAYMLVLSDELRSAVGSVSLYEHIPSSKYVKPTKMNRQLADRMLSKTPVDVQRITAVGYLGEEYVFDLLQVLLKSELDSKKVAISWYNKKAESGLAYDLTIRNTEGEEIFIEVKSSSCANRNYFPVTYNEWCFAQQKGARYEIFRVSGVGLDDVNVYRIVNPYSMWRSGKLKFCLSL
ncbi:hypothetical protein, conserved [Babesia bigemina]|uniref:SWIM-type domain-containing protein n=1 Tax=Babesia bigemina TaxID=5866 RepID=A0A061D6E7_BABBI|nr:hypothetical protein, conserved [Babesia bigemina]CDR96128.1 hypothetical protein, conserved [Babesia bigemina]|eukprot:XP_012768314.1 hypothetical protein, conserved [Babesia bigemina]